MEEPLEYAINTTTSIETNALLELVNESSSSCCKGLFLYFTWNIACLLNNEYRYRNFSLRAI